jgi:hypothetical protein
MIAYAKTYIAGYGYCANNAVRLSLLNLSVKVRMVTLLGMTSFPCLKNIKTHHLPKSFRKASVSAGTI